MLSKTRGVCVTKKFKDGITVKVIPSKTRKGWTTWKWALQLSSSNQLFGSIDYLNSTPGDKVLFDVVTLLTNPDSPHVTGPWAHSFERRMLWAEHLPKLLQQSTELDGLGTRGH